MPSARPPSTPADSGAFITKIHRKRSSISRIDAHRACSMAESNPGSAMQLGSFICMIAVWAVACGGRVDLPVPEGEGGAGATSGGGGKPAGTGGCPRLPTEPVYDCKARPKQPTD